MTAHLLIAAASLVLHYLQPAADNDRGWERESLPIGNGWFGASVFGGVTNERLQITHNAVLTRNIRYRNNPNLTDALEIRMRFPHEEAADYRRELDLDSAAASVSYRSGGVRYTREYFANYPSRVMVMRLSASEKGALNFVLAPEIPYMQPFGSKDDPGMGRRGSVVASGKSIDVDCEFEVFNLRFAAAFRVETDGRVEASGGELRISGATRAEVFFTCDTNYVLAPERFTKGCCDPAAPAPLPRVKETCAAAARRGAEALRREHLADYRSIFGRVAFDLGGDAADAEIPTDRLLGEYSRGRRSAWLEELYCQYGRYLLISSSRPGTLPANLQGIWAGKQRTPWGAGYWHNINLQMNYWPCFTGNMMECFEAYAAFNAAFRPATTWSALRYIRKWAGENAPKKGEGYPSEWWCVGIAAYPYFVSTSGGGASALTSKLFMEWWDYTRDETVLKKHAWPVMRGLAGFLVRNVRRSPEGSYLCVNSYSHEQEVGGKPYYTVGCAFDQQMIYENNADTLRLADVLGIKDAVTEEIRRQLPYYDPVLIGADGQIKEFREEKRYGDLGEKKHRHISHLMAVMPGTLVTRDTPVWAEAARKTLDLRGEGSSGWSTAHRMNAWARLGDGDRAYSLYRKALSRHTLTNLWGYHPPFQIDGNFGCAAGLMEMLLQSHCGVIDVLPALPEAWRKSGSFRGLRARGAFEVDCAWADGRPVSVKVRSLKGAVPRIRFGGEELGLRAAGKGVYVYVRGNDGEAPDPDNLVLARRGRRSPYVIVSRRGATGPERLAATDFRNLIRRQTGVELPLVDDSGTLPEYAVLIGDTRWTKELIGDFDVKGKLGDEGFRLKAAGNRLLVLGGDLRGPAYGVYELLERFGGCGWYSVLWETVPEIASFKVPRSLDEIQKPAFDVRTTSWRHMIGSTVAFRNKIQVEWWKQEKFGRIVHAFDPVLVKCHTFQRVLPADKYFDEHPEYFALVKGKRLKYNAQPCLSNPDVIRIFTDFTLERIRKSYPKGARYYGLSQLDVTGTHCTCPTCKAVDDAEGSPSGSLVKFINTVAEEVERHYPDVWLETLVYTYTRRAPKNLSFRRNVMPCFCTLECDFSKPLPESRSPENIEVCRQLRLWGEKSAKMYVWDYTVDFHAPLHYWPNVRTLGPNLRFFRKNGVSQLYEQGDIKGYAADWARLKGWMLAKLMWNPDLDENALLDRFFRDNYGPAAEPVRAVFELEHAIERDEAVRPMSYYGNCFELSDVPVDVILKASRLFDEAKRRTAGTPYHENVIEVSLATDFMRALQVEGKIHLSRRPPQVDPAAFERVRRSAGELLARIKTDRYLVRLPRWHENQLKRVAAMSCPTAACDRVIIEDKLLFSSTTKDRAKCVDDPDAGDGSAYWMSNTHNNWDGYFYTWPLRYDPEGVYRLRMRVKVRRLPGVTKGEAFWAGVYNRKRKKAVFPHLSVKIGDVPDGEYRWYDVGEWKIDLEDDIWMGPGNFTDGRTSHGGVWVDCLEIVRVR